MSEHKHKPEHVYDHIVTSDAVAKQSRSKFSNALHANGRRLVIVLLVLLVASISVFLIINRKSDTKPDNQSKPAAQTTSPTVYPTYEERLQQEVADAERKVKDDATNAKLDNSQKAQGHIDLAVSYMNNNMYAEAINSFKQAMEIYPASESQCLSGIMNSYIQSGQRDKAIITAEKLLANLKDESSNASGGEIGLDQAIRNTQDTLNRLRNGDPL